MIGLFLNKYFWIFMSIIVALVLFIVFAKKYELVKWIGISLMIAAFLGTSVYSIVQLNVYYSAEGGIWGYISSSVNPKPNVEVNDLEFNFKNMELLQEEDTDVYSMTIDSEQLVSLDSEKEYALFVNGKITETVDAGEDYIFSKYTYVFYDQNKTVLLRDSLNFRFVFNRNNTYLYVFTAGGSTAAKYWTSYFNKNDFIVSIDDIIFDLTEETSLDNKYTILNVQNSGDYVYVTNQAAGVIYKLHFNAGQEVNQQTIAEKISNQSYENEFVFMSLLLNSSTWRGKERPYLGNIVFDSSNVGMCYYLYFDTETNTYIEEAGRWVKWIGSGLANQEIMRAVSAKIANSRWNSISINGGENCSSL